MKSNEELLLDNAIDAIRSDAPAPDQLNASAARVSESLGLGPMEMSAPGTSPIEDCADVRRLLAAFRAGTLDAVRSQLIAAHLHDCALCLHQHQTGSAKVVDWSVPKPASAWRPRPLGWGFGAAMAASAVLAAGSFLAYRAYWQIPPGVRAQVESIDGGAYRIAENGDRPLAAGESLSEGDRIRTSGGAHAVLKLSDGSTVEINERSILGVGARGRNMTVSLENGALIVQAAHRTAGHLFVNTADCRVAVTGTVFSINSGIKGSRVAVFEGNVHVEHLGLDTLVPAGNELATSDNLAPAPVAQQIAWSHDRDKFLPLLAQFSELRTRIGAIPSPAPRFSSDLLSRVPEDTLLYVSIPNLGDFLTQANTIFSEQLKQSPALQQWWNHGDANKTAQLDALIDKLHTASTYLGSEIVVAGFKPRTETTGQPSFAILADLQKPGFAEFLKQQLAGAPNAPVTLYDEASLQTAKPASGNEKSVYGLIREQQAVFSNSLATLKQIDAQLNAGDSGFAASNFGQQIAAAYQRGAGVIVAADMHSILPEKLKAVHAGPLHGNAAEATGMDGVEYLIAEHREVNGQPQNHLNLQFSGTRQRVASWLGAPASMGSLDFVTPNASVAVALLSKDPKEIADDLIAMTAKDSPGSGDDSANQMKQAFRDAIAANLGGEFLVSLDGPVLPTPSWKAIVEVRDGQQIESTLESVANMFREKVKPTGPGDTGFRGVQIESSQIDGQRYYALHNLSTGAVLAEYTFADGYMVVAPTRAMVIAAIHAHRSGDSLGRSTSFKALLPKDDHDNYSAVAYQNLSPVLGPLLTQFSGESADALRKLAADSKPTAICAWGRDTRIEAESDSSLFGFDFLTLGALIGNGNNPIAKAVKN